MVEYGNGVSQSSGLGSGHGGGSIDAGAALGQFIDSSIRTISSLPPTTLVAGLVLLVIGLLILKRAF